MAILAVVRGLSIAASFFTAGQLANTSFVAIPNILRLAGNESITAQMLAKQFLHSFQVERLIHLPLEILSVVAFVFLAYQTHNADLMVSSWKLYAGAALSMLSVIPWTLLVMDAESKKIASLSKPGAAHPEDKEAKLEHGHSSTPAAGSAITPIEEFEPYEDAPFSGAEYEKLKIRQLLKSWNTLNAYRILSAVVAGACGLAAVTTRVTIVTIVQGN